MPRMIVASVVALAFTSSAFAGPAVTIAPAEMRASPNPYARIVQSIPADAEIEVRNCGEIWCSASWRDIHGFVLASVISADPEAPPPVVYSAPPPTVVVAPPVVVAPFGWGYAYGWGHPWRHYY
jgi:uncharacterized protein YraI